MAGEIPSRIGGYEILSVLGEGAMGIVYQARAPDGKRLVALKVVSAAVARNETLLRRLQRESRAAAALKHPNIVQGIDFGEAGGRPYFAMEYVEGRTVSQILKTEGPLPERRALSFARQIAGALHHAQRFGILHRDIKPSNVLVTAKDVVKLADLGLAKEVQASDDSDGDGSGAAGGGLAAGERLEGTLTQAGSALGTPYYMAPEQARGDPVDGRADIYALGATLYHMLAGVPPHPGKTLAEVLQRCVNDPPPDVRERRPAISEASARLVIAMMGKDPRRRLPSPEAVTDRIDAILEGRRPEAAARAAPAPDAAGESRAHGRRSGRAPALPPPPPPRGRRFALAAGLLALAGGAVFFLVRPGAEGVQEHPGVPPRSPGPAVAAAERKAKEEAETAARKAREEEARAAREAEARRALAEARKAEEEAAARKTRDEEARKAEEEEAARKARDEAARKAEAAAAARKMEILEKARLAEMEKERALAAEREKQERERKEREEKEAERIALEEEAGEAVDGTEEAIVEGPPAEPEAPPATEPDPLPERGFTNSVGMKLVRIEPGEFSMGSPAGEEGREADEIEHRVRLSKAFLLAATEVTQAQWGAVMGTTVREQAGRAAARKGVPAIPGEGDAYPMVFVSWDEAVEFCRRLGEKERRAYRLPTEAEWEYACRAGTTGKYGGTGSLEEIGWTAAGSGHRTRPVGQKRPNAWGLYDMHGNVYEWCQDWHGPYPRGEGTDPAGPGAGSKRVVRGGAWTKNQAKYLRSANRWLYAPGRRGDDVGFRPALAPPPPGGRGGAPRDPGDGDMAPPR